MLDEWSALRGRSISSSLIEQNKSRLNVYVWLGYECGESTEMEIRLCAGKCKQAAIRTSSFRSFIFRFSIQQQFNLRSNVIQKLQFSIIWFRPRRVFYFLYVVFVYAFVFATNNNHIKYWIFHFRTSKMAVEMMVSRIFLHLSLLLSSCWFIFLSSFLKKGKKTEFDPCKPEPKKNGIILSVNDMTNIRQCISRFFRSQFFILCSILSKTVGIFHCPSWPIQPTLYSIHVPLFVMACMRTYVSRYSTMDKQ